MNKIQKNSSLMTFYVFLVYALSTNSFFIPVFGFDFNPSKVLLLISLPFILLIKPKLYFEQLDFVFFIFVLLMLVSGAYYMDLHAITSISNYALPFLFYIVIRTHSSSVDILLLLKLIVLFSFLHACLGFIQFYMENTDLVFFDNLPTHKLKYANNYSWNPISDIKLLPQGFYFYSSNLAISLIFPLYILMAIKNNMKFSLFLTLFSFISLVVFLTFSRFEILSVILLILSSLFIFKNSRIIYKRTGLILFIFILGIVLYILFTNDPIGSVQARIPSKELILTIFQGPSEFLLGVNDHKNFYQNTGVNIPHNMYFFVAMAYGIVAAIIFVVYFGLSLYKNILYDNTSYCESNYRRIFNYLSLFLMFVFLVRAFDYYIVDGYENILLLFYGLTLLSVTKKECR